MKSLNDLLEKSLTIIAQRISTVEEEYLRIAGERLKAISSLDSEGAREYLFSNESDIDQQSDLNKIKTALLAAHSANIKSLNSLYENIIKAVEGDTGMEVQRTPKENDPRLKNAIALYKAIAASTAVGDTYRKAMNRLVNGMAGDAQRIGYARNMRKAIAELAVNGIAALDPRTGQRVNMASVIRSHIRNEFFGVIKAMEREAVWKKKR
jgi:hypothetical protein